MNINDIKSIAESNNYNIEKYEDGSIKRFVRLNEDDTYSIFYSWEKGMEVTIHNKLFEFDGRLYYTSLPKVTQLDFETVDVMHLIDLHQAEHSFNFDNAQQFYNYTAKMDYTGLYTPEYYVVEELNRFLETHPSISIYVSDINEHMYSISFQSKYPFNATENKTSEDVDNFGDIFEHEDFYTWNDLRRTIYVVKK